MAYVDMLITGFEVILKIKNRLQYIKYNNVHSKQLEVKCGVPQGSILGPLLFILYVNDICNVSSFLKCVLFADDTNLFASGNDLNILYKRINVELEKLNNWFKVNKLSLNVKKTNFMLSSYLLIETLIVRN